IVELVEPLHPDPLVLLDPAQSPVELLPLKVARPELGAPGSPGEAAAFEHLEVLGDARQGHGERRGQVVDGGVPGCQAGHDRPPGRISQGSEGGVELVRRHRHAGLPRSADNRPSLVPRAGHRLLPDYLTIRLVSCQVKLQHDPARGRRNMTVTRPHAPAPAIAQAGPTSCAAPPASAKPSPCRVSRNAELTAIVRANSCSGAACRTSASRPSEYMPYKPAPASNGNATTIAGRTRKTRYGTKNAPAASPTMLRCRCGLSPRTPSRSPRSPASASPRRSPRTESRTSDVPSAAPLAGCGATPNRMIKAAAASAALLRRKTPGGLTAASSAPPAALPPTCATCAEIRSSERAGT